MTERVDNKQYTEWERYANRRACLKRRMVRKLLREGQKDKLTRIKEALYARH